MLAATAGHRWAATLLRRSLCTTSAPIVAAASASAGLTQHAILGNPGDRQAKALLSSAHSAGRVHEREAARLLAAIAEGAREQEHAAAAEDRLRAPVSIFEACGCLEEAHIILRRLRAHGQNDI